MKCRASYHSLQRGLGRRRVYLNNGGIFEIEIEGKESERGGGILTPISNSSMVIDNQRCEESAQII